MSDANSLNESRQEALSDADAVREGTHEGLRYKVVVGPVGNYCGYVRTAFDESWHYDDLQAWSGVLLDTHGGVTYGVDSNGWLGFDCAHARDICVTEDDEPLGGGVAVNYEHDSEGSVVWTPDAVAEECESLAEQVADLQEFAEMVIDRDA